MVCPITQGDHNNFSAKSGIAIVILSVCLNYIDWDDEVHEVREGAGSRLQRQGEAYRKERSVIRNEDDR